jgi:hypothetical protein
MRKLNRNIDRGGRWARGLCGLAFLAVAAIITLRGLGIGDAGLRWTVVGVAALLGVFQLFEAAAGWCVARALGLRTPM